MNGDTPPLRPAPAPALPLDPALLALSQSIASQLQVMICDQHRRSVEAIKEHMTEMGERLERRIVEVEERVNRKVEELRAEIRQQGFTLAEHGVALARVEERLTSGDEKFDSFERRLSSVEQAPRRGPVRIVLDYGVPAGLGAALTAAIMRSLGA